MKRFEAQLEMKLESSLGEGPVWHPNEKCLYFVDIVNCKIIRYDPESKQHAEWKFPSYVGAIALGGKDELFAAVGNELLLHNTQTGATQSILSLDLAKDIRFNECKCDSQGRFWMGTMQIEAQKEAGAFFRVDRDGSVTQVLSNLSVPNGFCWSQDNQYLYHIDSLDHAVKRFEYDESSGSLTQPKTIISLPDQSMLPDGMCMDEQGNLWIAMWGGHKVVCYNPDNGELMAEVQVPAPHVTSCTFGGENFDKLYIITARLGLSESQLEAYPLSGSLFCCEPGVSGFETDQCKIEI